MAADVKGPGNRIGLGEHRCVGTGLGQQLGDHGQLFRNALAGKLQGLNREGGGGPLGLVVPDRVDGIAGERLQSGSHFGAGRGKALGLLGGEQPGVKTQDIALLQIFGNPGGWRLIDEVAGGEDLGIDLLAHLDGVAAINEYGALVKGEDGQAPGTGKTGEPAQAFGIGCHVFALEFVLPGNDQPVKLLFPEQQPKCVHARFVSHFRSLNRAAIPAKGITCILRQLVPYLLDRKLGPDDWPLRYPSGLRARKDSSNYRLHGSLCAAFAIHQGLTITQLKDDPMNTGTVKWFNEQKGYGFVQPDNGSKDVFVHISAVERAGLRTLKEGQKVSFEIVTDKRTGKSSAGNLTAA